MGSGVEKQERPWKNSLRSQIEKASGFADYMVSATNHRTKAATDNTEMNGHGPVIIELYKTREGDWI